MNPLIAITKSIKIIARMLLLISIAIINKLVNINSNIIAKMIITIVVNIHSSSNKVVKLKIQLFWQAFYYN